MKTINDLIKWLDDNGYQAGADNIRKMQTNKRYAKICRFDANCGPLESMSDLLFGLFVFNYTSMPMNYWYEIHNILCEIKENK